MSASSTPPLVRWNRFSKPIPTAKLPRKKCDNCDKPFPITRPGRRFCTTACRTEFHTHGSAFGPLRDKIQKLIEIETRQEVARQMDHFFRGNQQLRDAMAGSGFIHRSQLKKQPPEMTRAGLRGSIDTTGLLVKQMRAMIDLVAARLTALEGVNRPAQPPR